MLRDTFFLEIGHPHSLVMLITLDTFAMIICADPYTSTLTLKIQTTIERRCSINWHTNGNSEIISTKGLMRRFVKITPD